MSKQQRSASGIIQLSLSASDHHLTVQILQVKGLKSSLSNALVRITFIPDRKPLECHTRTVPNRNGRGVFNEKFTFEINDDDMHKRLCFSVYNYRCEQNQMILQGCLSFGIRNTLQKQKIDGWFYLLPEDIGELRHQQVANQFDKQVTKINRDIANLQEYQFTISRGTNDSFGFTVIGDSPTFIGKVSENSPAAVGGLKSGDYIVKINGQNVSRAQQRTVAHIIRHLKHSVTLDIHRYTNDNLFSLVSSNGASSAEDSSTYSDSSLSHYQARNMPFPLPSSPLPNRKFIDLAHLGHYIEPKSFIRQTPTNSGRPFYEMTNSSVLAVKGSPTNTFV
ncbi:unnamed protein product [Adineta ricciae]|uniref:Uncharacterized protein n=1 Tax=Adineta ricciae TaxID=249248 RepID=A0A816EPN8_ADIRI|nr:unnamed protein product [Adineta ricciae]CAF1655839.1 unnamed protein product [Adineta ricciae]